MRNITKSVRFTVVVFISFVLLNILSAYAQGGKGFNPYKPNLAPRIKENPVFKKQLQFKPQPRVQSNITDSPRPNPRDIIKHFPPKPTPNTPGVNTKFIFDDRARHLPPKPNQFIPNTSNDGITFVPSSIGASVDNTPYSGGIATLKPPRGITAQLAPTEPASRHVGAPFSNLQPVPTNNSTTVVTAEPPDAPLIDLHVEPPSAEPDTSIPAVPDPSSSNPNPDPVVADPAVSNPAGNNGTGNTININIPGPNQGSCDILVPDNNSNICNEVATTTTTATVIGPEVVYLPAGTGNGFIIDFLNNGSISICISMELGTADMYLMGNHMFRMQTRYVDLPGFRYGNVIELKGNGLCKMYLIKSRRILYFAEGNIGTFADICIR